MTNERNLFAALPTIDDEVNRRLHRRRVDAANAAGLLDVAYRTIDTPVGALLLAATPKGLVRVAYASQAAVAAGYRPCAVCLPDEHARWKARRVIEPAPQPQGIDCSCAASDASLRRSTSDTSAYPSEP